MSSQTTEKPAYAVIETPEIAARNRREARDRGISTDGYSALIPLTATGDTVPDATTEPRLIDLASEQRMEMLSAMPQAPESADPICRSVRAGEHLRRSMTDGPSG